MYDFKRQTGSLREPPGLGRGVAPAQSAVRACAGAVERRSVKSRESERRGGGTRFPGVPAGPALGFSFFPLYLRFPREFPLGARPGSRRMGDNTSPISVILVSSGSRGNKLLFRYPFQRSQEHPASQTSKWRLATTRPATRGAQELEEEERGRGRTPESPACETRNA